MSNGVAKLLSAASSASANVCGTLDSGYVIQSQQAKDLIGIISLHNRQLADVIYDHLIHGVK
jgi:hypothetical protein